MKKTLALVLALCMIFALAACGSKPAAQAPAAEAKVKIGTVTDVGGFGPMGRVLDLAPGTYKAFGFSSTSDWGTREVYYRFL